jgi:hypothetical protein
MNTTNITKLVACLAWAGVAIASAAPADAIAVTFQTGDYAACTTSYEAGGETLFDCNNLVYIDTYYTQRIKFVTPGCNTGGCQSDDQTVYTDFVYSTGRKPAGYLSMTCIGSYIYDLGSCTC